MRRFQRSRWWPILSNDTLLQATRTEAERQGITVEVDNRCDRMNAKIRDAQLRKIPYMLVVGDREAAAQAAALRVRGGTDLGAMPVAEIVEKLRTERDTRALAP